MNSVNKEKIKTGLWGQDPQKDEKLRILKEKSSWEREGYVKAQGWATIPFETDPDSRVAARFSQMVMKNSQ